MTNIILSTSVMLIIFSAPFLLLHSSVFQKAQASLDLSSIDELTENFTEKVEKIVSDAVNNTKSALNSTSAIISNGSNLSSSQIVISNNESVSASAGEGSLVLNQIKNENGVCTATKVGGSANDTLSSSGACNDQLTGGLGADKFTCGEGTDTIRDYSPDEGDTIIDRQSCETVL
jgi:Ca2+-binding RTX toxin-like protein